MKPSQERIADILEKLQSAYPDATIALRYKNPLELLVATILSAQCTDKQVNKVTKTLFEKYCSVEDYAEADLLEFEQDIHSTGFFRNKAKNIRAACQRIIDDHDGKVPSTMEELVQLPGIARKTANVILSDAFGKTEGVVVDTHVGRIAQRLGLSQERYPEKIERDLMALIPREKWRLLSHLLIRHGRTLCMARNPQCDDCFLLTDCPEGQKRTEGTTS